mgnify:CR=1 FL=1
MAPADGAAACAEVAEPAPQAYASVEDAAEALQQVLTDAVFADSVATGARAGPYTMLYLIRQFSGLASPLLQLGYFALVPNANHWTEATLRPAMLAGVIAFV